MHASSKLYMERKLLYPNIPEMLLYNDTTYSRNFLQIKSVTDAVIICGSYYLKIYIIYLVYGLVHVKKCVCFGSWFDTWVWRGLYNKTISRVRFIFKCTFVVWLACYGFGFVMSVNSTPISLWRLLQYSVIRKERGVLYSEKEIVLRHPSLTKNKCH